MTVIADPNKRVWMLARLGKNDKHTVIAGPTTWGACEKAFDRNRNKKGLFVLTKGQVRGLPKRLRRAGVRSENLEVSKNATVTSIEIFDIATKITLQNL